MIRSRLAGLFLALIGMPAVLLAAEIIGTNGPDVLEGTPQADRIDGRGGADEMMGLPGNDTYIVGQVGDQVLEAVGDGTDTIRSTVTYTLPINVENLTLAGGAAINGTGNELNNRITGNAARNTLNGRAGADRMFGRGGNDIYVVDRNSDRVTEPAGGGTDTVRSLVTHTLSVNVENLGLIGGAAINGTGNVLANAITGNAAANTLNGMQRDDTLNGAGGRDVLIGGLGNDRLTGGVGLDVFVFDTPNVAANLDRITDFTPADDEMRLIGEVFPALSTAGTLPAAAFGLGAAATAAADRILYDSATGILRYDSDGTGPDAAVRFGTLLNGAAVTNADFVVVDPVATAVDYATQIQPIFNSRCTSCHSGSGAAPGPAARRGKQLREPRQRREPRGTEPGARRARQSGRQLSRAEGRGHRRGRRPHAARRQPAERRADRAHPELDQRWGAADAGRRRRRLRAVTFWTCSRICSTSTLSSTASR